MPSKILDEYLKNASPAEKAALVENGLKLDRNGVDLSSNSTAAQTPPPIEERADVQQIGQDLSRNGAQLKPDGNGPQPLARIGESRPYAAEPKFMDEKRPSDQTMTQAESFSLKQYDEKLERSGQQNQPESNILAQQPDQKRMNAVDQVLAQDARQQGQAKAPEQQKEQQTAPQSKEPER